MVTPDPTIGVYVISVAAELAGLHPQTLRTYERMGLITPRRTGGGGRRYSHHDIEQLRAISDLTSHGIGIEGVRRILDLENQVLALSQRNEELVAEVDGLRQALRAVASGARPVAAANLPALRSSSAGQMVVWRRGGSSR
ncbi:MerR family transcriptional regulator [Nocardioides sp. JQ2195]|uniref:heat shock protein transcriptional repressor HspR n=1 Tax=Nocardioides sp. JQ2195 TaxID=2592334 RepID=UPI00143E5A8E|nr:MerR family transcriptional regulator [Nocardioides sp. JQ2195]QIX25393.1 MerR family transcriptional regulator [Nocardioides sp. JQ2195]